MKNQWMAYVIVAVISALAGVAIAGPPNNVGTDATIIVPESIASTTTVAPVATAAPSTTVAAEPDAELDAEPDVAEEPDENATTTTEPAATTTTTEVDTLVAPADLIVVSVNGAGTAGLATRVRNELRDAGYTATRATDGTTFVDDTVVYFFPLFEREAALVAEQLGLDPADVQAIEFAPQFGQIDGDQVAVYIGRDRS